MNTVEKHNRIFTVLLGVFIYCSLFLIFLFNFFGADDYSMQVGEIAQNCANGFDFSFRYGNGRFLGNLSLYYFNYFPIIRMIIKPLALTLLIFCLHYVFEIKALWLKIVTALIVIFPSSGFYSSCYSINACFGNYVLPVTNIFLCLALIKAIKTKKRKINFLLYFFLLLASVCMQLYSENSTIVFLVTAVFFVAYDLIASKKVYLCDTVFLIGGISGAVIMYIIPRIADNLIINTTTMSEYRKLVLSIPFFVGVIAKFAENISTAFLLFIIFGLLLIFIVKKESPNDKYKFGHILISAVYPIVCLLYQLIQTGETKVNSNVKLALLALMGLFLLNAFIIILRFIKPIREKTFLIFMTVILAMSAGMFMFVNLHGYRTFYLSLFILFSIILYLAQYIFKTYSLEMESVRVKQLSCIAAVVMVCFVGLLQFQTIQNYDFFAMRQEYVDIKIAEGCKDISVSKVPNTNLVRDEWIEFYKAFYTKNAPDVKITFIDREEWSWYWKYRSMLDNPIASVTYAVEHLGYGNNNGS